MFLNMDVYASGYRPGPARPGRDRPDVVVTGFPAIIGITGTLQGYTVTVTLMGRK